MGGLAWLGTLLLGAGASADEPIALPNVGPSQSTFACQIAVQNDYYPPAQEQTPLLGLEVGATESSLDPPVFIDPYTPLPDEAVFDGVERVTLGPGVVTPEWSCSTEDGCYDTDNPVNPRGTALLWIPDNAPRGAPRVLFIHGGSWYTGSPWSSGYAPFVAKLARGLTCPYCPSTTRFLLSDTIGRSFDR